MRKRGEDETLRADETNPLGDINANAAVWYRFFCTPFAGKER